MGFFCLSDGNKFPLAAWMGWVGEFTAGPCSRQTSRSPFGWVKMKPQEFLTLKIVLIWGRLQPCLSRGVPRRCPEMDIKVFSCNNASLDRLKATELLLGGAGEVGNGSRHLPPIPFCCAFRYLTFFFKKEKKPHNNKATEYLLPGGTSCA